MTIDPRNARGDDPWTSLAGTGGINPSHMIVLVTFLRVNDRAEGWTHGECSDEIPSISQANAHKRLADAEREGLAYKTGVTRLWHGSNHPQTAWRAVPATPPPPYHPSPAVWRPPPMMLPPCVLWVDPGGMTGLAWLWNGGASFHADEYPFDQVGDHIEDTCRQWGPGLLLGYETYKVRANLPQTNANDAIQPIGLVRHYGLRYGCHIVHADPADRKTGTRRLLTKAGWWVPGKNDAQSAAQHLWAWCLRENCLPPRERAIMSGGVSTL